VLGLMAFIYIASIMVVLGLEVNVVIHRHLYPRALLTPFTDNVILTAADQRAYSAYAKSQRHKGFQSVEVTFAERGSDTGTQQIVDDQPPTSPATGRDH
jgi:membrane protein